MALFTYKNQSLSNAASAALFLCIDFLLKILYNIYINKEKY